jgi:large subunit ribosomal protein L5e
MPFVKIIKNKAYFKRFQVKYRRRREGKTDYRARRQMIIQDKTKFGAPKYRLVARVTNKDIITQIVHAKVQGDDVLCAAYAHELKNYGVKVGLTNYAAAYATGLLLARRTLTKLKIADKFAGVKDATGEFVEPRDKKDDEGATQFPFKAILDVGLARTTTGARIFGVMKGAFDGGINIPHKPNRFPGFNKEKGELNAKVHRAHIFGAHVGDYMKHVKTLKESNPDEPNPQFNNFNKEKLTPEGLEAFYKKLHAAIRADPKAKPKKAKSDKKPKRFGAKRLSVAVRKENAKKKVAALRKELGL